MATIVKTPSGTWKALIRKQGWPTKAKTFRTRRDADDWARRTEDSMVRGVYIERGPSERMLLADALLRYLAEVTPLKKSATQRAERVRAATLTANLGKYSLAALDPELVASYRDKRLAQGKSASTVRLELALLGHLFTVAIKEWRLGLARNPVSIIRKPTPARGRDRRLSATDELRLRAAVGQHANPMMTWIFEIALETGMRAGEIIGLRMSQVDLARRIVRLSDTKNNSARTVPLTKSAQLSFSKSLSNPIRPADCDLVFFGEPGRDGVRRPYNFNKVWLGIKRKLGISDLRFHDLRHEAVSRLVEAGLSDQEVSAISGHKSMQMLKRYTHLRAEDLVGRLDLLEAREVSTESPAPPCGRAPHVKMRP